jgi:ribosomal protein S18 acetylase RimI-like enzyme
MDLLNVEASDYPDIKKIYHEAFPLKERSPFLFLKLKYQHGKADFLKVMDEGALVGFAYIMTHNDLAYIFLFAIAAKYRGGHHGTHAIKMILEKYKGKRVYLALEDWRVDCANKEQRIKRHDFYQFCGFHDLPYQLQEDMITYSIMGNGKKVEPWEHKTLTDAFLGTPLKYFIEMKIKKRHKF